jgi:hypothetical protein
MGEVSRERRAGCRREAGQPCHPPSGSRFDAAAKAAAEVCHQRIIIAAIITATITAAMIIRWEGLLIMCRSMPNLVPSGSKSMPHFGHFPGVG